MKITKVNDEEGLSIPDPYRRKITVLFSPDKGDVAELTFSHVVISPRGQTDRHTHDRPELIFVLSGQGTAICDDGQIALEPNVALWALRDEPHQICNTETEDLILATVFIPAYEARDIYHRCLQAAAASSDGHADSDR